MFSLKHYHSGQIYKYPIYFSIQTNMLEILKAMELRHLHYFIVVAEELHFARAAERLHMAQPPLSQQIQKLEQELGVQLFYRTRRHVQLTEAGYVFLEQARLTIAQAEQAITAVQRASRGEIGRLVIGFVGSAMFAVLPDILRVYRERFPDVHLVLRELTTSQQVHALHNGRIDVGFIRPPLADDTLSVQVILREPLLIALPENHPLSAQPELPLQALAREPFILFPRHLGSSFYDQIVSYCQQAGFSPGIVQEAIEMQTIVSLVAANMGVALVPASLQNLRRVGVAYKSIAGATPITELAMTWRKEHTSPVLEAFMHVVEEALM